MLKFATVGTSWITSSFIEAALASGSWEFCYAYSRDAGRAGALIRKYGKTGAEAFTDLSEVANKRPDAAYIASPNSLHREQSVFFLERGIDVICEKPAALHPCEWVQMTDAADNSGALIFEAFRHINSPGFDALKNAVSRIGRVRNAIFSNNQYSSKYGAFLRGERPNVFNPEFGGGAMTDLGVYPVSLAAALWGVPKKLSYAALRLDNGADGAGSMILEYGDFLCNITFSKIADGIVESEIIGEDGGVSFDRPQELSRIVLRPRTKNENPKTKLSDYGKNAADIIDLSAPLAANKMEHEAKVFAEIIADRKKYAEKYKNLLKISADTREITAMCNG